MKMSAVTKSLTSSGKDSTLNEKGTAALMTVELDSDKGPQV